MAQSNSAICPILTLGMIGPPKERSVIAPDQGPQVQEIMPVACLGLSCMFFVPDVDPQTQKVRGGDCAVRIGCVALYRINENAYHAVGVASKQLEHTVEHAGFMKRAVDGLAAMIAKLLGTPTVTSVTLKE